MQTAKKVIVAAVAGLSLTVASMSAKADILNIVDYIDGTAGATSKNGGTSTSGETAVTSATGPLVFNAASFSGGTLAVDAYGSNVGGPTNTSYPNQSGFGPWAYLDAGGTGNAGMGVCQTTTSGNQCTPASDDNVTGTTSESGTPDVVEILSLVFDEDVTIDGLFVNNEGHNSNFGSGKKVAFSIGDAQVAANYSDLNINTSGTTGVLSPPHQNFDIGAQLYTNLGGGDSLVFNTINLMAGQVLNLKWVNQQFYLSAISVTAFQGVNPVPLPAGLVLLISGLMGLGFLGRYRSKSA